MFSSTPVSGSAQARAGRLVVIVVLLIVRAGPAGRQLRGEKPGREGKEVALERPARRRRGVTRTTERELWNYRTAFPRRWESVKWMGPSRNIWYSSGVTLSEVELNATEHRDWGDMGWYTLSSGEILSMAATWTEQQQRNRTQIVFTSTTSTQISISCCLPRCHIKANQALLEVHLKDLNNYSKQPVCPCFCYIAKVTDKVWLVE